MTTIPASMCPICGKPRGGERKTPIHIKCSKILQRRWAAENATRAARRADARKASP